jgi:glutaredoxin
VKEFLSREGVTFTAKNVDDDEQAYTELVARGFRSIPVTIIGEQAIRGYDEPALRAALAARRQGGAP